MRAPAVVGDGVEIAAADFEYVHSGGGIVLAVVDQAAFRQRRAWGEDDDHQVVAVARVELQRGDTVERNRRGTVERVGNAIGVDGGDLDRVVAGRTDDRRRDVLGRRRIREVDQVQRGQERRLVVSCQQDVGRVDASVPVEVVGQIDGRRVEKIVGVVSHQEQIGGRDLGVGVEVAALADGIAEVEDVVVRQARVFYGEDGYLEPPVADRIVGPSEGDAVGIVGACLGADGDRRSDVEGRPAGRIGIVAGAEDEVVGVERGVFGQAENVDHNAVDAAAVAGVVFETGGLPRKQGDLVDGDGHVVEGVGCAGGVRGGVEGRVVVEDVAIDHGGFGQQAGRGVEACMEQSASFQRLAGQTPVATGELAGGMGRPRANGGWTSGRVEEAVHHGICPADQ